MKVSTTTAIVVTIVSAVAVFVTSHMLGNPPHESFGKAWNWFGGAAMAFWIAGR